MTTATMTDEQAARVLPGRSVKDIRLPDDRFDDDDDGGADPPVEPAKAVHKNGHAKKGATIHGEGSTNSPTALPNICSADVAKIEPHPSNPRTDFAVDEIKDLARSIEEHGLLQPLLVRPHPDGRGGKFNYQLINGHRRLAAAKVAKLRAVPVRVISVSDAEALILIGVENVDRKDLNAIELAEYLSSLTKPVADGGAGFTAKAAAERFGKSESWLVNLVRLLELPEPWRGRVISGEMEPTKARCLVPLVHAPHLLSAIDEAWSDEYEPLSSMTRQAFAENLDWIIGRETEPVDRDHEISFSYPLPSVKLSALDLDDPKLREELAIVDLPVRHGHGKKAKVKIEPRITNVAALQKRLKPIAEKRAKNKKTAGDKQDAKVAKMDRELTAAEKRIKAADAAKKLAKAIEHWQLAFKRFWLADHLKSAKSGKASADAVSRLLLWVAAAGDDGRHARRSAYRALGIKHAYGVDPAKTVAKLEQPGIATFDVAREILWPTGDVDPYDVSDYAVDGDFVTYLAAECGFDWTREWGGAQDDLPKGSKALVEKFFTLHGREQLDKLGDELGVFTAAQGTKSKAVESLVLAAGSRGLKLPAVLQERKPRAKKGSKK